MHALGIALRMKKPEIFDEKIRPYLTPINLGANSEENIVLNVSII